MVKYDVVASIGTYQNNQGETKYVNRKVGAIIQTQKGPRLKLDASFNPAGCIKSEDGGVWLALFEPVERDNNQQAPQQSKQPSPQGNEFEDDIPF